MTTRITRAPGDPTSDTPDWICITNQRINVFKSSNDATITTKDDKLALKHRKRVMMETGFRTALMIEKEIGYKRESVMNLIRRGEIETKIVDGVNWIGTTGFDFIKQRKAYYDDMPLRKAVSKSQRRE